MSEKKLIFISNKKDIAIGESVKFKYPGIDKPALLIRIGQEKFVAYSGVCSHLQAEVFWDKKIGRIVCSLHDGMYEPVDGRPTDGLPKEPLQSIPLEIDENGDIYAPKP